MVFWNSLAFSKIQQMLAIWSLVPSPFLNPACTSGSSAHVLLKPSLKDFAGMWNEFNCTVIWTFFGIVFLWDWNENWPFQSCGHGWVFQICGHIEHNTLTASSSRIWNSSAEIPTPPLALFIIMLPKTHLPSHSRMNRSRWVTTSLWLTGSLRAFLYSSSVYSCHHFCFCYVLAISVL